MRMMRILVGFLVILALWYGSVTALEVPAFIFPPPDAVIATLISRFPQLLLHAGVTLSEIVLGLFIGALLGVTSAVGLCTFRRTRQWALPLMVVTQSLPVFALAPLLTLWFGYGMAAKVAMAVLIIYFPVVAASFDGLRHTPPAMLDLARTLDASRTTLLWHVRLPAALPSIASGIRVAASVAPIGAVVGEWVGSSRGLGYLMLHANGRMQTDLMFAALLCLCVIALAVYFTTHAALERCLYWQRETDLASGMSTIDSSTTTLTERPHA